MPSQPVHMVGLLYLKIWRSQELMVKIAHALAEIVHGSAPIRRDASPRSV
jgi:hypothetical protein